MTTTFMQQMTANLVASELRSDPAARIRQQRLRDLMRGTTIIGEDGTAQKYHYIFDGVEPLTELLDPAWSEPVAPVSMVPVEQAAEQAA